MHDVGDTIPLHFDVVDPATQSRVAADVTCTVTDPNGVETPLTVTSTTTPGRYTATFLPTAPGRHLIRWVGVTPGGAGIAANSDVINVAEGAAMALISLDEAREHLNIPPGEHVEDEELRGFITAATAAIEQQLGQVVARRTITETHDIQHRCTRLLLRRYPVLSVTSLSTADGATTWDPADLTINGATGLITAKSALSGNLQVVYVAGARIVPPNVILATQIVVAHLWQTQRVQSLGRAPGFGGEDFAPTVGLGFALPNRALDLLGGRPPVIA